MSNSCRKVLVPSVIVLCIGLLILGVNLTLNAVSKFVNEEADYDYTLDDVFDDSESVNGVVSNEIIRPYISDTVKIGKYFYDKSAEASEQEESLILYENTYMQNSGVDYIDENDFDVVSIADGEVIGVEDSNIYGKIITIKHSDNLISVYSGIKDVLVNTGYTVNKGEIIASSNKSILNDASSSLHFEVYFKNEVINPETLYTLSIEEFK